MEIEELKEQIKDPASAEAFEILRDEANEYVRFGTVQEKKDLAEYISGFLSEDAASLNKSNPDMFDKYETYWALLTFKAFIAYSSADQDSLLRQRLLFAIQKGFEPDDLIKQFYDFYESDSFVADNLRIFVKDLDQNVESLGNFPIEIEGKRFLPQIKYWMLDYSKYPSQVAKRGNVERLNYINHSQNVTQLTQIQRQNLLKVLKFYDDLLNPVRPLLIAAPEENAGFEPGLGQVPVEAKSGMPEAGDNQSNNSRINIEDKLEDLKKRAWS